MYRCTYLEQSGAAQAIVSDRADGDCRLRDGLTGDAKAFCGKLGIAPGALNFLKQVHGNKVIAVAGSDAVHPGRQQPLDNADGMVTAVAGIPLAVSVADCVPLFLYSPQHRAGGLIHAGLRGTFNNIARVAVEVLANELNVPAGSLYAWIGPSAGPCCYEVSEEMAARFTAAGWVVSGRNADLWATNTLQLVAAGVPRAQVQAAGICTICDARFHSYRRDPGSGRNLALLAI